jgi:hypothetical protein
MRKVPSPVQDLGEGAVPYVNWRLLNNFSGQTPKLFWTSIPDATSATEFDSPILPSPELLGARHKENKKRRPPDTLLGCKVFWDVFQTSRLVIIFDRYADDKLLRRIDSSLDAKAVRTMQTLLVLGGTTSVDRKLVPSIQARLVSANSVLKMYFVPGMRSDEQPFPHDRFAVTDGEFWHFGGSVVGHEGLTGVSRGWRATDVGVEKFVTDTWTALAKGK